MGNVDFVIFVSVKQEIVICSKKNVKRPLLLYYYFVHYTELAGLIRFTRPFLDMVSKAKAAKMVRGLVDLFLDMEAGTGKEVRHTFDTSRSMQHVNISQKNAFEKAFRLGFYYINAGNQRRAP